MRRLSRAAIVIVTVLAWAAPLAAQGGETGKALPPPGTTMVFVNTASILPVAPGADSAQTAFQAELQSYENELQGLAAEIDSLLAAYRRQESLLDPAAKQARQQAILQKQQDAQNRQLELERQSESRRSELLQPILNHVRAVIEEMRSELGYSIVFDIAESGVIAADPSLDITAAVLERLGVTTGTSPSPSR